MKGRKDVVMKECKGECTQRRKKKITQEQMDIEMKRLNYERLKLQNDDGHTRRKL